MNKPDLIELFNQWKNTQCTTQSEKTELEAYQVLLFSRLLAGPYSRLHGLDMVYYHLIKHYGLSPVEARTLDPQDALLILKGDYQLDPLELLEYQDGIPEYAGKTSPSLQPLADLRELTESCEVEHLRVLAQKAQKPRQ